MADVYIFTSALAGYDTRSIFKRSLTGFNSDLFISKLVALPRLKKTSVPYYSPIAGERIIGVIPFPMVLVRSPDGDTDHFDIEAGVLQRDTLVPYLFIICLDYVLRTSIDKIKVNGFELTKIRSWRYPAKTITDTDNTDDIALLANAPTQAETLLHSPGTSCRRHRPPCQCTQNGIHVL